MARVPFEIVGKTIDTGYTDTMSVLIDIFKLARERREYNELEIPSKKGFIRKKKLIVPDSVEHLISSILNTDFEQYEKWIKKKGKGKHKKEKQIYYINYNLKDYNFYYNPRTYYLSIMIEHSALLGNAKFEIMNNIRHIFKNYLGLEDNYLKNLDKATKLSRIDYKRDYRYRDEQHLSLMKFIIEKAPDEIVGNNYKKIDERDEHLDIEDFDDIEYMKKYKSPSNKTAEFVIYDKQLEQEDKFRKGKTTQEELEYFEKVIRFEVRIKNGKLNTISAKRYKDTDKEIRKTREKDIDNYKDEEVADKFFSHYAEKAFFSEQFYRLDYAIRLIYKSGLKPNMRKKLVKLVKAINEKGYTKAKQEYEYKHSFNNHISILRNELDINPLTFPTTWTDKEGNTHKTTYTTIPNFIQKKNCMYDSNEEAIIPSKLRELMEQEKNRGT